MQEKPAASQCSRSQLLPVGQPLKLVNRHSAERKMREWGNFGFERNHAEFPTQVMEPNSFIFISIFRFHYLGSSDIFRVYC
jgi:hypothetical protein